MAKITIVDSDGANVRSIRKLLEPNGHTLVFLTTANELLEGLRVTQPDVIIIGVDLEGSDGRELSKTLQTETEYKDIPVVLTSPFYHTDTEIRSFCCDDLVSMPFDGTRISTSIEMLLAKQRAKDARLLSQAQK